MVSNSDIGFVEPGQEAEIKVATFNFTRYGLLHGQVLSVSRDAVGRDDPQEASKDKAQPAAQGAKGPSDNQGPVLSEGVLGLRWRAHGRSTPGEANIKPSSVASDVFGAS